MKIVITGSLGNISRPLLAELVQKGHSVTVVSSKQDKQPAIEALGGAAAIGTLEDTDFLSRTFAGADAAYCMLPPYDYRDPNLDFMEKTSQLMNGYVAAIRHSSVKRIVHLSSVGAHMDGGNGLLRFHHLAEQIVRELPSAVAITHLRPVGFYNNFFNFIDLIKGNGFLGRLLALRFYGPFSMVTGKRGIILSNYGGSDLSTMVSPRDIAAAIAEELTMASPAGRKIRYVASDEMTCNEAAGVLGKAIGKPYLKWASVSDKQMLSSLQSLHIPPANAQGLVEMNAGVRNGLIYEDYRLHKPTELGKVKMEDFAKEFKTIYQQKA